MSNFLSKLSTFLCCVQVLITVYLRSFVEAYIKVIIVLVATAFCLCGCSVGPSFRSPAIEVPSAWKNSQDNGCPQTAICDPSEIVYLDHWWQVFDDGQLDDLETAAVANNRTLVAALERVQEARALVSAAAADFYPQITLNPLFTNTLELNKNYRAPGLDKKIAQELGLTSNIFRIHELLYSLPINLSYEVDLWGKIQDRYNSASYDLLAQQKDYQSIMLSLTSNLAIAYYQLRAIDRQLDLLANVVRTRQQAFEINQARYEEHISNYADVTLAGEEMEIAKREQSEAFRQRELLEDQIAVLIGVPASEFCLPHLPLTGLPPCIPEGIPSETLLRRPDIAEAEYKVRSEHAQVKLAYSQFFPSLVLTASMGFESPVFKDFMKWISRYWMDGAQANQLIFDGGRTSSLLNLQIARFRESGADYQQQVLRAFEEVENALANIQSFSQQFELSLTTTQWAQTTYQIYKDRYFSGIAYYIDVANTEKDLLNYQLSLNTLQGLRFVATIQLIKALGGGW